MTGKWLQGAALKEFYLGALRLLADMPDCTYTSQGSADDGRALAEQRRRLERLIKSMEQLSPDHHLLNDPVLVPIDSMWDDNGVIWMVRDSRLQAAKAHDWQCAEEWLTAVLHQYDYMA
jgi:hypothetical protein